MRWELLSLDIEFTPNYCQVRRELDSIGSLLSKLEVPWSGQNADCDAEGAGCAMENS